MPISFLPAWMSAAPAKGRIMNKVARLEAEANAKRSRLEATLRRLEERTTLLGLVEDVAERAGALSPSEIAAALRRNPLLAAGLVLCIGLLAIDVSRMR